jgi:hypothetical protein
MTTNWFPKVFDSNFMAKELTVAITAAYPSHANAAREMAMYHVSWYAGIMLAMSIEAEVQGENTGD